MISGLLPIYGASAGVIGLMALFGHQNRRSGWQKSRRNLVQELQAIDSEWDALETTSQPIVAARQMPSPAPRLKPMKPISETQFSGQLATLHTSLNKVASVTPATAEVIVEHLAVKK